MKKFLVTLSIVMALGFSANAQTQSDGFFSYSIGEDNRESGTAFPILPGRNLAENQNAYPTPVGSGLLILAGMGLAYGLRKSKRQ